MRPFPWNLHTQQRCGGIFTIYKYTKSNNFDDFFSYYYVRYTITTTCKQLHQAEMASKFSTAHVQLRGFQLLRAQKL